MQYEYHDILVHFTGSIAFFFQEEVKEAALRLNVSIGKVLKSPLEGLKDYHSKYEFYKITEQPSIHEDLEQKSVRELLEGINEEDRKVASAVHACIPQIEN